MLRFCVLPMPLRIILISELLQKNSIFLTNLAKCLRGLLTVLVEISRWFVQEITFQLEKRKNHSVNCFWTYSNVEKSVSHSEWFKRATEQLYVFLLSKLVWNLNIDQGRSFLTHWHIYQLINKFYQIYAIAILIESYFRNHNITQNGIECFHEIRIFHRWFEII